VSLLQSIHHGRNAEIVKRNEHCHVRNGTQNSGEIEVTCLVLAKKRICRCFVSMEEKLDDTGA
jgi:hypothetical protein